ncbi:MAG: stage V sporulation protein AB [Coprococcus sp.]
MKWLILGVTGIASGAAVAAGLFTFLAITGVPHRLMAVTHTSAHGYWYEWMLMGGGIIGNLLWLMKPSWHLGQLAAGGVGLFTGLFVGCMIGAIAEVLDAFPVFLRRAGIKKGIAFIVTSMAIGKAVGVWLWYFVI